MQPSAAEAAQELSGALRLGLGGALLLLGLALTPLALWIARRVHPGQSAPRAAWGLTHVLLVALGTWAVLVLASLLPPRPGSDLQADLLRSALVFGCGAALALVLVRRLDQAGWRTLGLARDRNPRALLAGLLAYPLLVPGVLGLGLLWSWALEQLGRGGAVQELLLRFRELEPGERALPLLLGIVLQPLLEELLFRGFLQPVLVRRLKAPAGIALTSLCFAVLHGTEALLPIFGLSLILGAVMLRTQRLSAVWALHALHNALMFLLLYATELVPGGLPGLGH